MKRRLWTGLAVLIVSLAFLYAAGYGAALLGAMAQWRQNPMSAPVLPDPMPWAVLPALFHLPEGPMALAALAGLAGYGLSKLRGGLRDEDEGSLSRNVTLSDEGSYGTAGFLTDREAARIFTIAKEPFVDGNILGMMPDGRVITLPTHTRLNANLAICGASGTGKSRSVSRNLILQSVRRRESVIVTDPKSELYNSMAGYLEDSGYTVRVLNLVDMAHGDSWDVLGEVQGDVVMAQTLASVILANTGGAGKDPFWYNAELNLLVSLILYLCFEVPPAERTFGRLYDLISQGDLKYLENIFARLEGPHLGWDGETRQDAPCLAPFRIFLQASEGTRSGVVTGLGSKLQVLQIGDVRNITAFPEIDLTLPGQKPCAYFCIVSDQDSTFNFLSSLFFSCLFVRLIRYADRSCPGGTLPTKVLFVLDEFPNCCLIPDFVKKVSTIRSRGVAVAVFFQNVGQMRNRYPQDQWQEILGACDTTLFLGCTDILTATYISDRVGAATVEVEGSSGPQGKNSRTGDQYRESRSLGRRQLLTPDEVLRLPPDRVLIFLRGQKVYAASRFDYSRHSAYPQLREVHASAHVPQWKRDGLDQEREARDRRFRQRAAVEIAARAESARPMVRSPQGQQPAAAAPSPEALAKEQKFWAQTDLPV